MKLNEERQIRAAIEDAIQYGMKLAYADTETTNPLNTCVTYHEINFPYEKDSEQVKEIIKKVAHNVSIYLKSWVLPPLIETIDPRLDLHKLAIKMGLALDTPKPQPNTFKELAIQAKKLKAKKNDQEADKWLSEAAIHEAEVLKAFNRVFAEYVPLLLAENINYYALCKDKRYPIQGVVMVFEKDGESLQKLAMDKSGLFNYKGGFSNWPTDFFPEWIWDNLLSKIDETQKENS